MPKASKVFAKKINERFSRKQDEMQRQPGILGGGDGSLKVTGLPNFVYVTINDKTVPVYNTRVAPKRGIKVWVGYSPEEPHLFQVLSTRSDTPAGNQVVGGGFAPSSYYEWLRKGGGQDPLHVHLRAFSPLKIGVSPAGGLNIELFGGVVYSGTDYIRILKQDVDMTAHIPSTTDKCALVLVTIDNTGTVVTTKGSEIDTTAYDPETSITNDMPAIPADTVFVCGAVRVYTGQTVFRETHTNTDFIDLRFSGLSSSGGGGIADAPSDGIYYGRKDAAWVNLKTYFDTIYSGINFQRNLTADLSLADGEAVVTAGYINAGVHTITLAGDSDLVVIQGNDSIDRAGHTTSTATPSINVDLYDSYELTAQAVNITSVSVTGSPTRNQLLYLVITSTGTITISFGASFENGLETLPTGITGAATLEVLLRWNSATSKFRCVAVGVA